MGGGVTEGKDFNKSIKTEFFQMEEYLHDFKDILIKSKLEFVNKAYKGTASREL